MIQPTIKLPCGATISVRTRNDYPEEYFVVTITDYHVSFVEVELSDADDNGTVFEERATFYGRNISLWPIIRALEAFAKANGIEEKKLE